MTPYGFGLVYAAKAYDGLYRKYTGEPYVTHAFEVAEIVRAHGGSTEVIVAALLHDVIEDTDTTIEEIEHYHGPIVASYVLALTDPKPTPGKNRAVRKEETALRLKAAPGAVQTIKIADLMSNTPSIVKHDPKFARTYVEEKLRLLEVLTKGDPALRVKAMRMLAEAFASLIAKV